MSHVGPDWSCPWCRTVATRASGLPVICESRRCGCGALALGAPPVDTDEIVDDAINLFGIAEGHLTEFDADRIAGLRQLGIEVAEGDFMQPEASHPFGFRVLWFRRQEQER